MNAMAPLPVDRDMLASFFDATFRYADEGFVSLRSFYDDETKTFDIEGCPTPAGDPSELLSRAEAMATRAARASRPVVFAPIIATFKDATTATENALVQGLILSVECDKLPAAALARLKGLLVEATIIVASGGEWTDPETGELQDKLHLHWRLTEPTREPADHRRLKRARTLATALVGGDASNAPIVHPIRWPGSWHRKGLPRLARIVSLTEHELDLTDALERLQDAADAVGYTEASRPAGGGVPAGEGEARNTAELVRAVLAGEDFHTPLTALAMRFLRGGMPDGQAVLTLRGVMLAVPEATRDTKDGTTQPGRWQARFDDIPRAVSTARGKIGTADEQGEAWPEPVDLFADATLTGAPELKPDHLPDALFGFVTDTAGRMGVDPAAVALAAIVSCCSVMGEAWRVQPKQRDNTWTESARLWGAIVGPPSILKSPVISACTKPVDRLDSEARRQHADDMRAYKLALTAWKQTGKEAGEPEPAPPRLDRFLVEGCTVEALSEVLRDDDEARQHAPLGRVLVRQDELSEWASNMDRYRGGGKGGGDRGAYLRLFNGGRYVVDRIGRGSFAVSSWSACIIGGIQPEPIQRIAREAADDGLLQRFLYVVPSIQTGGEDRAPDRAAGQRYEALFPALTTLHPPRQMLNGMELPDTEAPAVVLHTDAHAHRLAMDQLATAIANMPDTSNRLKAALGKWPGLFARIALAFHLIDAADARAEGRQPAHLQVLSAATAAKAAAMMRAVFLPHLLRADALMFSTVQTGHARWIAGFILAKGQPRVALRDILQAYGALRAPEHRRELQDTMESLVSIGWVRAEPRSNPAASIAAWGVNPAVHSVFMARAGAEKEQRAKAHEQARLAMRSLTAPGADEE